MPIPWEQVRVVINPSGRSRWRRGVAMDGTWSPRTLEDNDLWYIWTGQGWMNTRQGKVKLKPGMCLWLRPGWMYEAGQNPRKPLGMNFVHFDLLDDSGHKLTDETLLPPEVLTVPDPVLAEAVTTHLGRQFLFHHSPPYPEDPAVRAAATLCFTGLLMHLELATSQFAGGSKSVVGIDSHRRIVEAAETIREQPATAPSVTHLARTAGYSTSHFAQLFQKVIGKGPKAFIVQVRIDRARHLLRATSLPIKEIAAILGYRDVYFFSRQFRAVTGMSPTEHRQRDQERGGSAVL